MFQQVSVPLLASSDADEYVGIIFGALVVLGIALWIDYLIANTFYNIACQKGHDERKYFHFCFWLGAVGYIMVAALPDRKTQKVSVSEFTAAPAATKPASSDELPEL